MDPMKFIRDQLGPANSVDVAEFNDVKQNVTQLNEAVSQMKGELIKVTSILSKLTQSHDGSIDDMKIGQHNDSNQSMENNVGDSNHASILNDDISAELFDDTANQTVINTMEQEDSIVQANNFSTEKPQNKIAGDEFTMEIVEVDVMSQTSLELLSTSHIEKCIDIAQNDETISNSVMNTSAPKMTMHKEIDSITFGDFGESSNSSHHENVYNNDVADQNSSTESAAIENGASSENFAHAMNAEMVIEDAQIDDSGLKSIDCQTASTPKKLLDESDVDAKMDINIEDLPIIMKSDGSEDQL